MLKVFITATIISMLALFVQVYFASASQAETKIYKAKCDSLQHVADSLYWELLPTQIEFGRYQVAYEIFAERNPKAAKQYGDIISNETE
jgi:hypothetical protein